MPKRGKNHKEAEKKFDRQKRHDFSEAIQKGSWSFCFVLQNTLSLKLFLSLELRQV